MKLATALFAALSVSLGLPAPLHAQERPSTDAQRQEAPAIRAGIQSDALPPAPSQTLLSRTGGGAVVVSAHPTAARTVVNGRTYVKPDEHALVQDYLHDTYGLPGFARTTVRALYAEGRGKPTEWGTDAAGFGQRFGSAAAVTAIDGTVRFGFENVLHEDLRYLPCHGCSAKKKIENALLAEITARHGEDGHRSFSLTTTIADMSGPIITHALWYPGASAGPEQGAVVARTIFATRIGGHLFREFIWERRHRDAPYETIRP